MVQINVVNFLTVGIMALVFMAAVEFGKNKFMKKQEAKTE